MWPWSGVDRTDWPYSEIDAIRNSILTQLDLHSDVLLARKGIGMQVIEKQ